MFKYLAYGIPIVSSLELVAFIKTTDVFDEQQSIFVSEGKVPDKLENPALEVKPFSVFNENELLYTVPDVARYYIRDGKEIIIEKLNGDWSEVLLFFYSNCMAAALFQRNLIPFHVSGIFVDENRVLLFAAPSRTGKSTTSIMLQQKGYAPFTDDTAVLSIEGGKCFAQASYPMIRLWQNTIKVQQILDESCKLNLRSDIELGKYGFMFHKAFVPHKVEVAGIVFLAAEGSEISISRVKLSHAMQQLGNNIYRRQWLSGMKKHVIQFEHLTGIINAIPAWKAVRPTAIPTFDSFAEAIEEQIINLFSKNEILVQ
ncbi:hypothetical protein Emtol_1258 [Emticicia oligotrophica DSM 17448]|uniref:Serine kinase n=1 Tax=Emticicia oligotrophica (strain DSM 17448 / CIP 109782 / MTCC 6937 / GPTSA100-15) TaxID=929562 RepID=A0ABM5MZ54_EMTOG|nr:hypothetical protein [Emticicia oligotrophica]AFK02407.1 hypothetical protein Emtol_1258 [Emticicia oligotrophica DSM 17448]